MWIHINRGADKMNVQAITLMEAYIIENLRKHGVSNEELIAINDRAIDEWEKLATGFDFAILTALAEQSGEQFSSIINDGYTVKFLTLNGLVNLVQLKLDQTKNVDFHVHEDGISNLVVDASERKQVEQILSPNWQVTATDNRLSIRSVN